MPNTARPLHAVRVQIARNRSVTAVVAGKGPPVLFDAGAFGLWSDGYWMTRHMAASGFRAIAYTRAGLYGSDPVPRGKAPDPFFHAEDMARLLSALGEPEPVLLAGHSMGGIRIHAFAQRHPTRTRGLLYIDAIIPERAPGLLARSGIRTAMASLRRLSGLAPTAIGRALHRLYPDEMGLEGEALADKMGALASPEHLTGAAREVSAALSPALAAKFSPLPARLPRLAVEATHIAQGTIGEGGRTVRIEGASHAGILNRDNSAILARHLTRLARRGEAAT